MSSEDALRLLIRIFIEASGSQIRRSFGQRYVKKFVKLQFQPNFRAIQNHFAGNDRVWQKLLGNALLKKSIFPVGRDMESCTNETSHMQKGVWSRKDFEIIDTPGNIAK